LLQTTTERSARVGRTPRSPEPRAATRAARRSPAAGDAVDRLKAGFDAVRDFPALAAGRERLVLALVEDGDTSSVVFAVESDLALGAAVLREANRGDRSAATIAEAVDALGTETLHCIARRTTAVEYFDRSSAWGHEAEAHRRHVTAVQAALHRISAVLEGAGTTVAVDLLATAALLHDVGGLVLTHARAGRAPMPCHAATPEERLGAERREFGVDHALVGGILVRRWGLPQTLARLVERHHANDVGREAAVLRLADLVAHHGHGDPVSPQVLSLVARQAGIDGRALRVLLYEQGLSVERRRRAVAPCPLSTREMDVLRKLSEGGAYADVARKLGISTSTVRTHLHHVYGKIGAADRTQAVLTGVERGWLRA
jgi:DNA-binding CsgD family transcriptional regulator/HD-like signal output (HDOD) protein